MSNDLYKQIKELSKLLCQKKYGRLFDQNQQAFEDIFHDSFVETLKYRISLRVLDNFWYVVNTSKKDNPTYAAAVRKYKLHDIVIDDTYNITETDLTEYLHDIKIYQDKYGVVKKKAVVVKRGKKSLNVKNGVKIQELYDTGTWSKQQLADKFKVSLSTIKRCLNERQKATL